MKKRIVALLLLLTICASSLLVSCEGLFENKSDTATGGSQSNEEANKEDKTEEEIPSGELSEVMANALEKIDVPERFKQAYTIDRKKLENAASAATAKLKAYAKENGLTAGVKIDTHEGNIAMRKMLEKNGFVHCGVILLESGAERVAYQYMEKGE